MIGSLKFPLGHIDWVKENFKELFKKTKTKKGKNRDLIWKRKEANKKNKTKQNKLRNKQK